jgi:acyl dehydratase
LQQKLPEKLPENLQEGDQLHHEDLAVGKPYAFGHKLVTEAEIIAFGRTYDPQPMHTDPEAAKATPVGGLCTSGWHTCAIMMRMVVDGILGRAASLGSPGVDEVRWKRPVRPGDVLSIRYTVQEKRVLSSRPDVGISKVLVEAVDANGAVPATWLTNQLTLGARSEPVAKDGDACDPQPVGRTCRSRKPRRLLRGCRHRRDGGSRQPHLHARGDRRLRARV